MLLAGRQPGYTEVSLRGIFGRPGVDVVGHLRVFTRRALIELLRARGFHVVSAAGSTFPALPRRLHAVDRLMSTMPSVAAALVVAARPA
jgi:hypothetical protein